MTLRATVLGLLLAVSVVSLSHLNDAVIGQTFLTGNFLPPYVFGLAVLLVFLGRGIQRRTGGGLRPSEIAVVAALGLAACGWPGNSFGRMFTTVIATPWHWQKADSGSRALGLLSYLPNGKPALAEGHVRDWDALRRHVLDDADGPFAEIRQRSAELEHALRNGDGPLGATTRTRLLLRINDWLGPDDDPDLQRARRAQLQAAAPDALAPPPAGAGLLLPYDAKTFAAVDQMLVGSRGQATPITQRVPWDAWWPALRVWVPLVLCFAAANFCMALIVHPQWSGREKLAYPIVRFFEELLHPPTEGVRLGPLGLPRLFWVGLVTVLAIHLINGAHAFVPELPHLPLRLNFVGLGELFPNAASMSQVSEAALLYPTIYPSVVALATLIAGPLSLSMGLSTYLWMFLSAAAMRNGVSLAGAGGRLGSGPHKMMLIGAYLGALGTLLYIGRTYYTHVARAALTGRRFDDTPGYAVAAARAFPCFVVGLIATLVWAGVEWPIALIVVAALLVMYLVLNRVAMETGAVYLQSEWAPIGLLVALLGFDAIGPTQFLLVAILSIVFSTDVRDNLLPHLQHGLYLVDRQTARDSATANASSGSASGGSGASGGEVRRFAPWQLATLLGAFGVLLLSVLTMQYTFGLNLVFEWPNRIMPSLPFWIASAPTADAAAEGSLQAAVQTHGLARFSLASPEPGALPWFLVGLALYTATAAARLKLPWWPLHPVIFLVWGTLGIAVFGPSFLLGWLIKTALVRLGGVRAYEVAKPLMIGLICGELLAALSWMLGGALYFGLTDLTPPEYRVFPA